MICAKKEIWMSSLNVSWRDLFSDLLASPGARKDYTTTPSISKDDRSSQSYKKSSIFDLR